MCILNYKFAILDSPFLTFQTDSGIQKVKPNLEYRKSHIENNNSFRKTDQKPNLLKNTEKPQLKTANFDLVIKKTSKKKPNKMVLRQRKNKSMTKVVQELDAFPKVPDTYVEQTIFWSHK